MYACVYVCSTSMYEDIVSSPPAHTFGHAKGCLVKLVNFLAQKLYINYLSSCLKVFFAVDYCSKSNVKKILQVHQVLISIY